MMRESVVGLEDTGARASSDYKRGKHVINSTSSCNDNDRTSHQSSVAVTGPQKPSGVAVEFIFRSSIPPTEEVKSKLL